MFTMALLSICIKLYMLNVLQFSKLRPFCIVKNQTFPFITPPNTVSTASSTLTTASVTTMSSSAVTTASTSRSTSTPLTTTNSPSTTASVTSTTAVVTTVINTRQRKRKAQNFKNGYEYIKPQNSSCPNVIEYCLPNRNKPTQNCPCFDLRTSTFNGKKFPGRTCTGPEKDIGFCTKITNCPLIIEEYYTILKKRLNISYEEFIILSKCRETEDQICCPIRNR